MTPQDALMFLLSVTRQMALTADVHEKCKHAAVVLDKLVKSQELPEPVRIP